LAHGDNHPVPPPEPPPLRPRTAPSIPGKEPQP
jgi:hypothetical protein